MADKKVKTVEKTGAVDNIKQQLEGFKDFIKDQGLIGMAIGLILGTAAGNLVKSLIENVIMPPIGLILGSADGLKGLSWEIGRTMNGQIAVMKYGEFLNELLNFLVVAAVVYFIVMAVAKFFGEDVKAKK
ncbi:MAG: MscL family protein [bacterium]|nr:MscL family protein [bacterium]